MPVSSDSWLSNFIKSLGDSLNEDNLPDQFCRYLQQNFPDHSFALIAHAYSPRPYRILTPGEFADRTLPWLSGLDPKEHLSCRDWAFCQIENVHLFPFKDARQRVTYILLAALAEPSSRKNVINLCSQVQNLFFSLSATAHHSALGKQQQYRMYIDNLTHDFNSLIALLGTLNMENESLRQKINYGKKLTRDFLFYLAEPELSRISLSAGELLNAILQNYTSPIAIKNTSSAAAGGEKIHLSVDPVLVNRAVQAVLDNAVYFAGMVNGKVHLELDRIKNHSLYIAHDWIKLCIVNTGPLIPAEYLRHVSEPLFTTLKDQGKVGLGLAIADKIIQAHGGCLQVSNHHRDGVQVTICLPVEEEYA